MLAWQDIHAFYLIWPWMLSLLALIPLGWWLYCRNQRRKIEALALSFSYTALVQSLKRQPAGWKLLIMPIAISLVASVLMVSLARPTVVANVPVSTVDMMLVLDISLSMMADDIRPDRMTAAKEAASRFVDSLPQDARIGLEFFAGDHYVLSPPTRNHGEIVADLQALQRNDLKPRTEIGSALKTALAVLQRRMPDDRHPAAQSASRMPPERVIILLSDGDSHEGYPWDLAARDAKARHVRIHTVGIGSAQGGMITYQGMELPVQFDETTLRRIAAISGGDYFRVFTQADFRKVYEQIRERTLHDEEREIDVSFLFAGVGLLALLFALLLNRRAFA